MTALAAPAPGPAISRTWLIVLLSGVFVTIVGATLGYVAVRGVLSAPILDTPGSVSEQVHAGEYLLYARSGSEHGGVGVTISNTYEPQLRASAFTLTEDGSRLTLAAADSNVSETEQRGSQSFLAVAKVRVPHSGRLTLTVADDEGAVFLGPSLGGTIGRVVPGVVLGLLGVILIVTALVLRSRALARVRPQWRLGPHGYGYQLPGETAPAAASGGPRSTVPTYPPPPRGSPPYRQPPP